MDTASTFPSAKDRQALRLLLQKAGWNLEKAFTEQERWWWHAYDYGFRRVLFGDFHPFSPIDERDEQTGRGKWFDLRLAAVAEAFYRAQYGKHAPVKQPAPTSQDVIRTNWRGIPAHELTAAERKLAEPEIARLAAQARRGVAAALKRSKAAFQEPRYFTAREIHAPQLEATPPDPLGNDYTESTESLTRAEAR